MVKLRKFSAYRKLERPYTRISKFTDKTFIRANPNIIIARFEMGNPKGKFQYKLNLVSKDALQIRHNALESARQTSNRYLEGNLAKSDYHFKILVYPHHILRENPLASGAGADRFSTGMQHSFGKPISCAARIRKGQPIIAIKIDKVNLKIGRKALERALHKLPGSCSIQVIEN